MQGRGPPLWALALVALLPCLVRAEELLEADILVFGGTASGVAAAVQASRMGKRVVLVEPGYHLGGVSSGGLGATDIGNKGAIGGVSREFYRRIGRHYGLSEAWTFEPHMAERVCFEMLNESMVPIYFRQQLKVLRKEGARILEIETTGGKTFRAQVFIDASYEGDLMARATVTYVVGREANSRYEETLNGVRANTPKHQFDVDVSPYLKAGDTNSGLLPLIQPGGGGIPGEGDRAIQAYNFRLCLTRSPANRRPIEPPADYDATRFELLARYLEALAARGFSPKLGDLMHIQAMPNGKTDINNNGGFSTDFIGGNWEYPEGDASTRAKVWKAHEDYTRGFLHFLATSPRVPAAIRDEMQSWGLCRDEFADTGGWPHQLYIREARRMVSSYVMTERNCRDSLEVPDTIGLAAYTMDSHNCQRLARNGRVENEGDVQVGGFPPYPIAYRSIVPDASECANLLVPVCLSGSHIAYGSIRMEPVFMVLGQAAATAAVMAVDAGASVQEISIGQLQAQLRADGQILQWQPEKRLGSSTRAPRIDPSSLPGVVLDDTDAQRQGDWFDSTSPEKRLVGEGYIHDMNWHKGGASLTFRPDLPAAGPYEILLSCPTAPNRATNVPVTLAVDGAPARLLHVNQGGASATGWVSLGVFNLPIGRGTTLTLSNGGTDGYVVADGVQFLPKIN